ncbi:TetR-like C-terminal domain-containing protein, partial [Mycolicibacterium mageritense]|uniref:TetR-like C-terminal domain-containing protein n=1 Tax=Mycolicibacterium mageritense TaxID=53462 RepID=UPI001E55167C
RTFQRGPHRADTPPRVGNYVTAGVGNYMTDNPSNLGKYVTADNNVMQDRFLHEQRTLVRQVLQQAISRGEIGASTINEELCDLLPGYLIFRCIFSNRPPTHLTIETLVDNAILPKLISATE